MSDFLLPPGRMVQGSLHQGQDKDQNGNPLTSKAGLPITRYFFAVAIPKNPGETHWSQTVWGAIIHNEGAVGFPAGEHQRPNFSWKVLDGDSPDMDEGGKVINQKDGFAGCWVVRLSSGFAPQVVQSETYLPHPDVASIKRGHWIEVSGSVASNSSTQRPGVYLNHGIVCFVGFGEEISSGPDASQVGFGQAPMPAGVQKTPLPVMGATPAPVAASVAAPVPMVAASVAAPVPMVAPTPVATPMPAPNPAILQAPVAAAPQKVMLPAANGASYEDMIAAGWNDETLIQHQMMQA